MSSLLAPRVLIITDHYNYGRLLEQHLTTVWSDVETKVHEPAHSGKFHPGFTAAGFDCVLLDHQVSNNQGMEWLADLSSRKGFPPIMYFAPGVDTSIGERAVVAGAADWFVRDRIHNRRFASVIGTHVDRRRRAMLLFRSRAENDKLYRFGPVTIRGQRYVADLAVGGSSMVYLAESEKAGEFVVLKVLGDSGTHEPHQGFERFLQEYELLLRIRHPNVVRIHEMGIADDHAYIAMEYFPSGDLRARMREPISTRQALEYTAQIARALAAVHEVGVLHRDLKPGNIMLRNDGSLALIDFGLAKHVLRSSDITAAGTIFGTPYYISPEQGHGEEVDLRSDLYSLGVILYEMLMQERPFTATTPMAIIYQHRNARLPKLRDDLQQYESLIQKLLAKEPKDRFQSADELLGALASHLL